MGKMDLTKVRKELHQIPELAFQEVKTRELLLSYLQKLPDIIIHRFANSNGILVEYAHGKGDYLLFRADMDALPIEEKTGCDFASRHRGMMHACGHDIHMTVLLGLIFKVVESGTRKNLLFLFQPAEEGLGGAESVLAEGLIQSYQVSCVFALHVSGKLPLGTVSAKAGIFFAIPQEFDVEFIGKPAHAAFPQDGKNALKGGLEFFQKMDEYIKNLQSTETVIFNIGLMQSGNIRNIIPDRCLLQGTHRTLSKEVRNRVNAEINAQAAKTAAKHQLGFEFRLLCTYDPVVNDSLLIKRLETTCRELDLNYQESGVFMTGEDFGFFTTLYPGLLFWLGAGEEAGDLHSDKFLPDDRCIQTGINLFYQLLLNI